MPRSFAFCYALFKPPGSCAIRTAALSQRAERIGLIVQNRRFLVLAKTRMPNLASRALALAVNALPAAWEHAHGYRPLLAETFTDIEAFEGTCYKAAAWQPCGITKGFTREHRAGTLSPNGL